MLRHRLAVTISAASILTLAVAGCGGTTKKNSSDTGGGAQTAASANPNAQLKTGLKIAYLPKQLSDDEIRSAITEIQSGGESRKGMIMKALKEKHGAALDGRRATTLLDEMGIK